VSDKKGWKIRNCALHAAIYLENELCGPYMQTDDTGDAHSRSADEAATLTARHREVTPVIVDRVLQHAEIFDRYLRAGAAGDDLDALLAGDVDDAPRSTETAGTGRGPDDTTGTARTSPAPSRLDGGPRER
jgi:hypothetical protein